MRRSLVTAERIPAAVVCMFTVTVHVSELYRLLYSLSLSLSLFDSIHSTCIDSLYSVLDTYPYNPR